jgi:hypothetical protein
LKLTDAEVEPYQTDGFVLHTARPIPGDIENRGRALESSADDIFGAVASCHG